MFFLSARLPRRQSHTISTFTLQWFIGNDHVYHYNDKTHIHAKSDGTAGMVEMHPARNNKHDDRTAALENQGTSKSSFQVIRAPTHANKQSARRSQKAQGIIMPKAPGRARPQNYSLGNLWQFCHDVLKDKTKRIHTVHSFNTIILRVFQSDIKKLKQMTVWRNGWVYQ